MTSAPADIFDALSGPRPRPGRKDEADAVDTAQMQRRRVISALLQSVSQKGYVATSVSDVVTLAQVSRGTFYSHFADKEDCFVAAYEAVSKSTVAWIGERAGAHSDPVARLVAGVDIYLEGIFRKPALSRIFYVDIFAAGPRAIAIRRAANDEWAAHICRHVAAARERSTQLGAVTFELRHSDAVGAVVGVNELVLRAIDDGDTSPSAELRESCLRLFARVMADSPSDVVELLLRS